MYAKIFQLGSREMDCFRGCFLGLQRDRRRTVWGPGPEVDEIPSHDRPRVGSWASPVPSMPAPFGTWETTEVSEMPKFVMTLDSKDSKDSKPRKISSSAQPERLQEIGISKSNSPPNFMLEQLLSSPGSLPQGLTHEECEQQVAKRVDQVRTASCDAFMPWKSFETLSRLPQAAFL